MIRKPQLYLTKVFIQIFLRNKQYIFFSLLLPVVILGIVGLNDGERDPVDIGLVDYSNSNISKDLFNHGLELRIQELESKFSKDMSETTFNKLKELKNERKSN